MADIIGSGADVARIRAIEKQREEKRKDFENKMEKMKQDAATGLKKIDQRFSSITTGVEAQFKAATVGLVSAEEYSKRRMELELAAQQAKQQQQQQLPAAAASSSALDEADSKKRKPVEDKKKKMLSFELEDEEQAEEVDISVKKSKISKNPDVDTSFLPDKERDEKELQERVMLAQEWKAEQERIKNESIDVTYSYWDGSGHRRTVRVKKGYTIEQFLETARRQVADEFSELRTLQASHLIYVKEDLIIPHHHSFYDLIINKARGKSGPLFHFDVRADVRLMQDVRVEKEDSHAGKVMSRSFYDKNKHIFPYSRYEVYDPKKEYDRYTIHGAEINTKK